jgi:hypothetical protein
MSYPKVIDAGHKAIAWTKKAVSSVKSVLNKGLQFFVGHNADNSTNGRRSVGEVVGSFEKTIGGVLNEIVIGYFPNKAESKKYDVCSIEADVDMSEAGNMTIAEKITRLTGIALGSSNKDKPAFPGAKLAGQLQCFGDGTEGNIQIKKQDMRMEPTFEEIKQAARKKTIFPSQIFDMETMRKDNELAKIFDGYDSFKDENAKLKTKVADLEKSVKFSEEKGTAKERLKKFLPEKMTKRQEKFFDMQFKPENLTDLSDDGLKGFAEKVVSDYATLAKELGFSDSEAPDNTGVDQDTIPESTGGDNLNTDVNEDGKTNEDAAVEAVLSGTTAR